MERYCLPRINVPWTLTIKHITHNLKVSGVQSPCIYRKYIATLSGLDKRNLHADRQRESVVQFTILLQLD